MTITQNIVYCHDRCVTDIGKGIDCVNGVETSENKYTLFVPPNDWVLDDREMCDLEMLMMGAFEPLKGFMRYSDYNSVLTRMRLADGSVWPIPIVLRIPVGEFVVQQKVSCEEQKNKIISEGSSGADTGKMRNHVIKLRDKLGTIIAELQVVEIYQPSLEREIECVVGCFDENHPYTKYVMAFKDCVYVGGDVRLVHPVTHFDFIQYRLTPTQVNSYISENKYECIVAFQTRNPMHRSHFEITKTAMETVKESCKSKKTLLLLTPVVGPTQDGDISYTARVRCYKSILKYYEGIDVKLVLLPLAMRMAGPREAVWHSIIRRNFGCTHFIVGRDHAGPSVKKKNSESFYDDYEAQHLVKALECELGIIPIFAKNMVCTVDGQYIQEDCENNKIKTHSLSGTKLREMLQNNKEIPSWFSFPEVSVILRRFYRPNYKSGFCVYFTGLPCAGKSALAVAVQSMILENEEETRKTTVLDADIVRRHLSFGLGFSKEDRRQNVRRIGYVASEIVKHRGICLVANIAPYTEDRTFNRKLISSVGGYIEVHVSTPLAVCEKRDIKELYKKARLGIVKQFTGISDPYETPENPEIILDSSCDIFNKAKEVVDYLRRSKWIL